MKKIVAVFLLMFSISAIGQALKPPLQSVPQEIHDYACNYLYVYHGLECGDLPPAQVAWSTMVGETRPGEILYGYYVPGFNIIVLNMFFPEMAEEIAFHESIHYIETRLNSGMSRCESEEAARKATALFMGKQYNEFWKLRYGCEAGWKGRGM